MTRGLSPSTRRAISAVFGRLPYGRLGPIYCDEGGAAFWKAKQGPCRRLGSRVAAALLSRLRPGGRSLYVGAGVAELPALVMETLELGRGVSAHNLRQDEVRLLQPACAGLPFTISAQDARRARGPFDHLWMLSVLNDPERFPELSRLSYGRADPVRFQPARFAAERRAVRALAQACLDKLCLPALVTTSVEELVWVEEWCGRRGVSGRAERTVYPTAIVADPLCFIRLQSRRRP